MTTHLLRAACAIAAVCLATGAGAQTPTHPTGTTGATAFQPAGPSRGEAEAGTGSPRGEAGMQQAAKPGFDNKPPKGARADCHRPQGGVDASGGENLGTASKDNTSCTAPRGKADKTAPATRR